MYRIMTSRSCPSLPGPAWAAAGQISCHMIYLTRQKPASFSAEGSIASENRENSPEKGYDMLSIFDPLREFSFISVLGRLLLAFACAGVIGYGRSIRGCAAGLRTYMIISIGAAMSILLTMYEYEMLSTVWAEAAARAGQKLDASRLASQAITGIGFLGAGTILKVSHQQVNGLTTATGLFAVVCLSIAAGAGFFECALLALILIILVLNIMTPLEVLYKRRLRNITLNIEMDDTENIEEIRTVIEAQDVSVFEIDIEAGPSPASAIFILKLSRERRSHSAMLSTIAEMDCVRSVEELIS